MEYFAFMFYIGFCENKLLIWMYWQKKWGGPKLKIPLKRILLVRYIFAALLSEAVFFFCFALLILVGYRFIAFLSELVFFFCLADLLQEIIIMRFWVVAVGLIVSLSDFGDFLDQYHSHSSFRCWYGTQKGEGQLFIEKNFEKVIQRVQIGSNMSKDSNIYKDSHP